MNQCWGVILQSLWEKKIDQTKAAKRQGSSPAGCRTGAATHIIIIIHRCHWCLSRSSSIGSPNLRG